MMHKKRPDGTRTVTRRPVRRRNRQVMQPSNNLPVPTTIGQTLLKRGNRTIGYGNRGDGASGFITSQVDKSIDKHFTDEGAAFVHRACHPNDESRGGGVFIPDDTTADRAVLEERPYGVIAKPADLADKNWDCQIAVLPTPDTPYIYRTRETGTRSWSRWQLGGSSSFVNPGKVRVAQTVSDEATVVDPEQQAQAVETPSLLMDTTQFRQAFAGITVVMNCSSLHDEGYVTAGQWGNKAKVVLTVPSVGDFSSTNFPTGFDDPRYDPSKLETLVYESVPSEVADIVAACPEFGQWEAKKGIYMPLRFDDPVHLFNGGAISELLVPGAVLLGTRQKSGYPILMQDVTSSAATSNLGEFLVAKMDEKNTQYYTSAGQINQTFGFMMFSGINNTSQLICKMRTGLDVVPAPNSKFAAFTQKGPVKDQLAIDMATSIQAKLPIVYEHKYNSLGWLAGLVGSAAKTLLPALAPWIGEQASRGTTWLGNKIFGNGVPNV